MQDQAIMESQHTHICHVTYNACKTFYKSQKIHEKLALN